MPPPPVVEDLEVIEQLAARRRPRGPRGVVDELDLQRREETLGHGVVPAIAPAAHAGEHSVPARLHQVGAAACGTCDGPAGNTSPGARPPNICSHPPENRISHYYLLRERQAGKRSGPGGARGELRRGDEAGWGGARAAAVGGWVG